MTTAEEKLRLLEERLAALESTLKIRTAADEKAQVGPTPNDAGSKTNDNKINGKPEPKAKPTSRARVVISKWDKNSETRRDYDLSELGIDEQTNVAEHDYAFLLRKLVNPDENAGTDSELEIVGRELQRQLRSRLEHTPMFHMFSADTVTLSSPYEVLIHNWDELEKLAGQPGQNQNEQLGRSDLRLLLDTIKEGSDSKLDDYFKIRDSLKASKSITYDTLWTIFPPGSLVYSTPFLKFSQVFIVQSYRRIWPLSNSSLSSRSRQPSCWILQCWTYDWNGRDFQRYGIDLRIDEFTGLKPISSLSVQPFELLENREQVEKELQQRGELFRKYCIASKQRSMFTSEGKAILDKEGFRSFGTEREDEFLENPWLNLTLGEPPWQNREVISPRRQRQEHISGEVMVDFESYYKHGLSTAWMGSQPISEETAECKCPTCTSNTKLQKLYRAHYDGAKGDEDWDLEQTMLCPPRLLGYVLREKQWVQLAVESIKEFTPDNKANAFWETLQLSGEDGGKDTKELLHALIKNHGITEGRANYQVDDMVAEKGKGLVILLYGPPGVGKTSTAQTIARAAQKPLFSIGVADIGTNASQVESNLEKVFDLATAWRAVLLIDEADVFLQSRARGQMGPTTERNALVSVFLRVLEYYQGILILTTNQISQFDVAVQSRIHIAIRYDGLDKKQTVAIFRGFLEQYKTKGLVKPAMFNKIMAWVEKDFYKKKFDGRQIRNIVTSSMGLACADEEGPRCMTLDDLQNVVGYMTSFKTDLEYQMRQYEESQSGNRNPYT